MPQEVLKINKGGIITLSPKSLQKLGLKVGDRIKLELDEETGDPVLKPVGKIQPELLEWTKKFIKKYKPALEAIAKK